ncbi:hypothetical protein FHR99_002247 [Litorivivens lipolytica]|uniref:Uncharacterized protein n=1 Tax=Litorivivens lipolytica TaxID=1524264 RepID=A0A7W4W5R3_9GAMM|nr:hypothetical protein [Litorivivens lipolytica]MBB3047981.1 hypothetical protein [Litorivivens lipolytica]
MKDYTVALALFDYVPIAFTALGMYWLCRSELFGNQTVRKLAIAGAALIISGGLLKASWKLIVASTGEHIVWMNNSLFILMAPGFTLLSYALFTRQSLFVRLRIAVLLTSLVPLIAFIIAIAYPDQRLWFFWLLAMVTLANTATIFMLARTGWFAGDGIISLLYILSFVGTISLSGLARIPEQTAALQWIEESINAVAQGLFFLGSLRLNKRLVENPIR